jgi:hypothetical protein
VPGRWRRPQRSRARCVRRWRHPRGLEPLADVGEGGGAGQVADPVDLVVQRDVDAHGHGEDHDEFAQGGLGRYADRLDVRVLFLPSDPEADVVPLDADVLAWLKEERTTAYGVPRRLGAIRTEARAARWRSTIVTGTTPAGSSALQFIDTWIAAQLQNEIIDRWQPQAPFELNVALRSTNTAKLGYFAEGWA